MNASTPVILSRSLRNDFDNKDNLNFNLPSNYLSKSAWLKSNRIVKSDQVEIPVALFATATELEEKPSLASFIRDEGKYDRVVAKGWFLYCSDQTSPKDVKTSKKQLTKQAIKPKVKEDKEIKVIKKGGNREEVRGTSRRGDDSNAPFISSTKTPIGLITQSTKHRIIEKGIGETPTPLIIEQEIKSNMNTLLSPKGVVFNNDKERLFVHNCIIREHLFSWQRGEFLEFHSDLLRDDMGKYYKKHINRLIQDDIVECDGYYVKGDKSYGYRLTQHVRNLPKERVFMTDNKIKDVIRNRKRLNSKVHTWLKNNLYKITIAPYCDSFVRQVAEKCVKENPGIQSVEEKERDMLWQLQCIQDKDFRWSVGENSRRFFTNVTSIKKESRALFRVDDQPLAELDLANSHPTILSEILSKNAATNKRRLYPDEELFIKLCQQGIIYDYFQSKIDASRNEIKIQLLKAFYTKNYFGDQEFLNDVKKVLKSDFPHVAKYIYNQKKDRHKQFAIKMQKEESKIFVGKIAKQIMDEHPDMFITTIHDAIMCKHEDVDYVKSIIMGVFIKRGIIPTIKVNK